jgi:hypothetical protein
MLKKLNGKMRRFLAIAGLGGASLFSVPAMDGCNATVDILVNENTSETEVVAEPVESIWTEWFYFEEWTYGDWYY